VLLVMCVALLSTPAYTNKPLTASTSSTTLLFNTLFNLALPRFLKMTYVCS
jgi:hypothetical protein